MTACNVVRMKVKPGREADFIASHRGLRVTDPVSGEVVFEF